MGAAQSIASPSGLVTSISSLSASHIAIIARDMSTSYLPFTTTATSTPTTFITSPSPLSPPTPTLPYTSTPLPTSSGPPLYLFIYGDSYSSIGFDLRATLPSPQNPTGNPPYPGLTSTGPGQENWVDILATNSPSNTLIYDFAMSGSCVDKTYYYGKYPSMLHFRNTSALYSAIAPLQPQVQTISWTAENSAHIIYFGRNDIMYQIVSGARQRTRLSAVLTSYFAGMSTLYAAGGRRFIVLGLGPVWREPTWNTPYAPYTSWLPQAVTGTQYWNSALQTRLAKWIGDHEGVDVSYLDTMPAFERVLDHSQEWGLRDATCQNDDPEVGREGDCPFADVIHPGPAVQRSLGIAVGRFLVQEGVLGGFALS